MFSNFSFKTRTDLARTPFGGFTLVEMMTVVAIILIMTAILLGNLPNFRDRLSLDAIAQEMAVTIRQAQIFGSATRTSGSQEFPSYGVYFDLSSNNNFIVFADLGTPPNSLYDRLGCAASATECREQFLFSRGVVVTNLCSSTNGNPSSCTPISGGILNVNFRRPLTDAIFYDSANELTPASVIIKIAKASNPTDTRSIVVWGTGHIYVTK
jgi:prepilin-type N-terminal cleavage/methylation domain-containing protein